MQSEREVMEVRGEEKVGFLDSGGMLARTCSRITGQH